MKRKSFTLRANFFAVIFSVFLFTNQIALGSETKHAHKTSGIWKAVAPQNIKGEFENHDPMGLIANSLIKADCSINWVHQNGKRYCFSSGTSLVFFLKMPNSNIQKATVKWNQQRTNNK